MSRAPGAKEDLESDGGRAEEDSRRTDYLVGLIMGLTPIC